MTIGTRDVRALAASAAVGSLLSSVLTLGYLAALAAPNGLYDIKTDRLAALIVGAEAFAIFIVLTTVASASAFTVGLAWRLFANRNGWSAWWGYALVGGVLGPVIGVLVAGGAARLMSRLPIHLWVESPVAALIGGATGLALATTVWLARPGDRGPMAARDSTLDRLTRP